MFELHDKVKIKASGITGIVVDIVHTSQQTIYTIESDGNDKFDPAATYQSLWPLYDCVADELESV